MRLARHCGDARPSVPCAPCGQILSSSQHQADVQRARGNQATAYMAKPLTMDGYVAFAQDLVNLWADGRLRA